MSKYVIYDPQKDAYLNRRLKSTEYKYVGDVNNAELFYDLETVWQLIELSFPIQAPVVLKVEVDVFPDHTVDLYQEKLKADQDKEPEDIEKSPRNSFSEFL